MRHAGSLFSASLVAIGFVVLGPAASAGCGSSKTSGFDDGTMDGGGLLDEAGNPIFGDSGGGPKPGGVGLQCQHSGQAVQHDAVCRRRIHGVADLGREGLHVVGRVFA